MVEMAERGNRIPFYPSRILPEGHPYIYRDICGITRLTVDDIKHIVSPRDNLGQEPLVRPDQVKLNHIPTNIYSPRDLEIFMRIQELKKGGLTIGRAIDTLREQLLIEKAQGLDKKDSSGLE